MQLRNVSVNLSHFFVGTNFVWDEGDRLYYIFDKWKCANVRHEQVNDIRRIIETYNYFF